MDFLKCSSFRELVLQESISPPIYERMMDAMEAVDRILQVEKMGDCVLKLATTHKLSAEHSQALLVDLLAFYSDPLQNATGIALLSKELRRYNQ